MHAEAKHASPTPPKNIFETTVLDLERETNYSRGVESLGQSEPEVGGLGKEGLFRRQVVGRQQSTEHPDGRLEHVHVLQAIKKQDTAKKHRGRFRQLEAPLARKAAV